MKTKKILDSHAHTHPLSSLIQVSPEVTAALEDQAPVVALESTIIAHGMPYPQNLETALEVEGILRQHKVTPATCAIMNGVIKIGLTPQEMEQLVHLRREDCLKLGTRDLPYILTQKGTGATTVSASIFVAQLKGIPLMVTGGIGGVHRGVEKTWDISADLTELSRSRVAVVCSGVKSILDIEKTLEYLETLGVPVVGYQTKEFPAFFCRESGLPAPCTLESMEKLGRFLHYHWSLGLGGGIVVANPIPQESSFDSHQMNQTIQMALKEMQERKVEGKEVTPFLLEKIKQLTEGKSLTANIALIKNNAKVGAQLALAYAKLQDHQE